MTGGTHVPAIASGGPGRWGVYCLACSDEERDYVYPCTVVEWDPEPPAVLADAHDDTPADPT